MTLVSPLPRDGDDDVGDVVADAGRARDERSMALPKPLGREPNF
jgi:hypothetical protein